MLPVLTPLEAANLTRNMAIHISRVMREVKLSSSYLNIQIVINYDYDGDPTKIQDGLREWLGIQYS
jgi:hypothetical protein